MPGLPVTIETDQGGYVLKTLEDVRAAARKTTKLSPGYIQSATIRELVSAISQAVGAWNVYYDRD